MMMVMTVMEILEMLIKISLVRFFFSDKVFELNYFFSLMLVV